jgi:GNAT superfamily N-acetyltransferase
MASDPGLDLGHDLDLDLGLRPAEAVDAPALAALHIGARAAGGIPTPYADHEVLTWVRGWLADAESGTEAAWVAEDADGIVGYARWTPTWLDDLYVRPDRWRHGVGTALLGLVRAHLPGGFGLYVFAANTRARAFYARHGLVEVAQHPAEVNPEGLEEVELAWPPMPLDGVVDGLADDAGDRAVGGA